MCAVVLLCGIILICRYLPQAVKTVSVAQQESGVEQEFGAKTDCAAQDLPRYLCRTASDLPYACAEISILFEPMKTMADSSWQIPQVEGTANIVWTIPGTEEEFVEQAERIMENAAKTNTANESAAEESDAEEDVTRWVYFQYRLREDTLGTDIRDSLMKRYGSEGEAIYMLTGGGGTSYSFLWSDHMEVIVYDGSIYALICMDPAIGYDLMASDGERTSHPDAQSVGALLLSFSAYVQAEGEYLYHWVMDEENLYWTDHWERYTEKENPQRSFLEIRGRDENDWDDIMECFAAMKEANYQVEVGALQLQIYFDLKRAETGMEYTAYLMNGFCTEGIYTMTVTDAESGQVLQETEVSLCVETTDTLTFTDLNKDGYADIQISLPKHSSGSGAVMDRYSGYHYMIWDPEEQVFVSRYRKEIWDNREADKGEAGTDNAELTSWTVEEGDCLWEIARKLYGDGSRYLEIYESNRKLIGEDPGLIREGMELILPVG